MMMKYIAHTENNKGEKHSLKEHLLNVAHIMKNVVTNDGWKNIFFVTGLLHDFGKYQLDFQRYLLEGGRRGSVPHASWGAAMAKKCETIK